MASHRAEAPCDSYFGNLCGGFGAPMVCMGCGWEKREHPSEQSEHWRAAAVELRAYMESVARARAAWQEQQIWMAQNPIHWRAEESLTA